ncbi:hypothetical protein JMJ77_0012914, partial [Colletotrichum scovillei]
MGLHQGAGCGGMPMEFLAGDEGTRLPYDLEIYAHAYFGLD